MPRTQSFNPSSLTTLLTGLGLVAAVVASACPAAGKNPASCYGPPAEPDVVTLAASPPEPAGETPAATTSSPFTRYRDGEHPSFERPLTWLLIGSGPKGGIRLSAERTARAPEHRTGARPAAARTAKAATAGRSAGGGEGHVSRAHRMPSPEIL